MELSEVEPTDELTEDTFTKAQVTKIISDRVSKKNKEIKDLKAQIDTMTSSLAEVDSLKSQVDNLTKTVDETTQKSKLDEFNRNLETVARELNLDVDLAKDFVPVGTEDIKAVLLDKIQKHPNIVKKTTVEVPVQQHTDLPKKSPNLNQQRANEFWSSGNVTQPAPKVEIVKE